ncbi:pseudouridine synthase [Salinicoccus halodurans]|uniref:Pseudouridine synthase n=1 Tax=Salinicoccus halodurans TaxID=407035 RepID=A0A0F7HLX2_9STAP|nr:pseudouridine synthase [Salinicoccus halodurans]AKG74061.1 pseudouridine synthase [Salinicoccus halodurans]SFK59854.1 23S rRNA pseudouridine2605 synthase [Salinicoccus halodurans]
MEEIRLQKAIADSGVTSRRKAEQLITEGRVAVNGEIVSELGSKVTMSDKIEVDGVPVTKEEKVHILYYKPAGEISAVEDDRSRGTVTDAFKQMDARLYPVGRLDYDTSGILLMTNDGEFTQYMTHPKFEMSKTYRVKIDGILKRDQQKEMRKGITLEDGKTAPAGVKVIRDKKDRQMILELTIHEGKNRQVRRMFEHFGLEVIKLTRIRYDFLTLDGLAEGEYRFLKPHEVKKLIANAKDE